MFYVRQTLIPSVSEVGEKSATATERTTTTLDDLYSTLKKLEEEENFVPENQEKKYSWCEFI